MIVFEQWTTHIEVQPAHASDFYDGISSDVLRDQKEKLNTGFVRLCPVFGAAGSIGQDPELGAVVRYRAEKLDGR